MSRSAAVVPKHEETTVAIGLLVFLGSSILLFLALLAAALLLRIRVSGAAPTPPWWWSLSATGLLFGTVYHAGAAERPPSSIGTLVWGTLFLGSVALLWWRRQLLAGAAEPISSALFFVLTGLHALYVVVGLCLRWPRERERERERERKRERERERERERPLRSIYWRFVGVAWLVTLAAAYLP